MLTKEEAPSWPGVRGRLVLPETKGLGVGGGVGGAGGGRGGGGGGGGGRLAGGSGAGGGAWLSEKRPRRSCSCSRNLRWVFSQTQMWEKNRGHA